MATCCPHQPVCRFFIEETEGLPRASFHYTQRYCWQDSRGCARFRVAARLGPTAVPDDLLPHQRDRVADLIARPH
jgi:hypothetical protein